MTRSARPLPISGALVVMAALVSIAGSPALAEPDPLKALHDSKPRCRDWREVSRLTRSHLRKSLSTGASGDLKLLELSFVLIEFCAGELERGSLGLAGLSGGEGPAQRAARINAALFAFYKQAVVSTEAPTALKSWPDLAKAANDAQVDLQAIIDRRFGEGAFIRYLGIAAKPEQSRTPEEQRTLTSMHPWMDPL